METNSGAKEMRCKTIGCNNVTRNPNRAECWNKYCMCRPCCIVLKLVHQTGGYNWRQNKLIRQPRGIKCVV